jgi:hypothetical protein
LDGDPASTCCADLNNREEVQMNIKRIIGTVLLVAGIALLILSGLADVIGIGQSPNFGNAQIAGAIIGAIGAIGGVIVLLKK